MEEYNQFTENSNQYLTSLLRVPPSRESAARLSGHVAASLKETRSCQTAALYLQAAARHLPATAAAASQNSNSKKGADMELEMKNTQLVFEIVEVSQRKDSLHYHYVVVSFYIH